MRIGTWNLDNRLLTNAHRELLTEANCDVWLLTEIHPKAVDRNDTIAGFQYRFSSEVMARKQHWAAVLGRGAFSAKEDPHAASAAVDIDGITFCSTILPWRGAPSDYPWIGKTHVEKTEAVLGALTMSLPKNDLVWGGDWNHSLLGVEVAGSRGGRTHLQAAIREWNLQVPTAALLHHNDICNAIDHIAVPCLGLSAAPRELRSADSRITMHMWSMCSPDSPLPSPPQAPARFGFRRVQFALHQVDHLFQHVEVFGRGDESHLGQQAPAALEHFHALFDAEAFERAAGLLHLQQLIDFFGAKFGRAFVVAPEPGGEFREARVRREHFQQRFVDRVLPVHPGEQSFERQGAEFVDGEAEGVGALADGGVAEPAVGPGVEDGADGVAVELRDPGEVFLVPSTFFDQAGDFVRQVENFTGGLGHGRPRGTSVPTPVQS